MVICLYGASSEKIDKKFTEATEALGREMAKRGHSLVFGGGGVGNMGAAARGVQAGGGKVISVVPRFFKDQGIEDLFDTADRTILTYTLSERKDIMENTAEAFIVTPGGIGTFDELFQAITMYQLGQYDKPVAIFNTDGYYDWFITMMDRAYQQEFLKYPPEKLCGVFSETGELLDYLEARVGKKINED